MKFNDLNEMVPRVKGGKEKILRAEIYPKVSILMPGRHAEESGYGDFCVCVTDPVYPAVDHQFTHTDIFKTVEKMRASDEKETSDIMAYYFDIIRGSDPAKYKNGEWTALEGVADVINPTTFFYAVQCLAVAEHRRYAKYESKWGGRYLPFRFAAGIAQGLWLASDAASQQRRGRPGVEYLEKVHGVPLLTQKLMKAEVAK